METGYAEYKRKVKSKMKKTQHSTSKTVFPLTKKYSGRDKDEITRETVLLALFYALAWGGFLYLIINWLG